MSEILNRFFSRNTLRNLMKYNTDEIFEIVSRQNNLENCSNIDRIKTVYHYLSKYYRNEYFYKNTILNKLLLGVHSVNTTTALAEINIGSAKPDFILINGKSVVYEIKTELDNLERLEGQIYEYYKVFDHVAVVTYEKNLPNILKKLSEIDRPVGIYILQKNARLKTIIHPLQYRNDLDKYQMFKVLRKQEYENIILKYYKTLPKTTQFRYYTHCEELFLNINIEWLYREFLIELKKRGKIDKEKFSKIPYELKYLVYFMKFNNRDYQQLELFLSRRD